MASASQFCFSSETRFALKIISSLLRGLLAIALFPVAGIGERNSVHLFDRGTTRACRRAHRSRLVKRRPS